jgi:uncharacterized MAPEG superfamily protein
LVITLDSEGSEAAVITLLLNTTIGFLFSKSGYAVKRYYDITQVVEFRKMIQTKKQTPTLTNVPPPAQFTLDMRVNKLIANDAENDTYFLILLLATAVFIDTLSGNITRTIVYGVIYLVIRIIYAFYVYYGITILENYLFCYGNNLYNSV